jgi:hypothetical protein
MQRQPLLVQYKQQANPILSMHNYTPLVISGNDKNKQLTILGQRKLAVKVLTNEKRGGLTVVPFDRSRFKMPRKFSNILSQAPSPPYHFQITTFLIGQYFQKQEIHFLRYKIIGTHKKI